MEEIGCRDSDRVSGPVQELGVALAVVRRWAQTGLPREVRCFGEVPALGWRWEVLGREVQGVLVGGIQCVEQIFLESCTFPTKSVSDVKESEECWGEIHIQCPHSSEACPYVVGARSVAGRTAAKTSLAPVEKDEISQP